MGFSATVCNPMVCGCHLWKVAFKEIVNLGSSKILRQSGDCLRKMGGGGSLSQILCLLFI